jgi:hypothetical protein
VKVSRVEECQITRNRLHGLEWMALKHLRLVRVPGELLAPGKIVLRSLPLSIVDKSVSSRDLVEQDVPRDLGRNSRYVPARGFLRLVKSLIRISLASKRVFLHKVRSLHGRRCLGPRLAECRQSSPCRARKPTEPTFQMPHGGWSSLVAEHQCQLLSPIELGVSVRLRRSRSIFSCLRYGQQLSGAFSGLGKRGRGRRKGWQHTADVIILRDSSRAHPRPSIFKIIVPLKLVS